MLLLCMTLFITFIAATICNNQACSGKMLPKKENFASYLSGNHNGSNLNCSSEWSKGTTDTEKKCGNDWSVNKFTEYYTNMGRKLIPRSDVSTITVLETQSDPYEKMPVVTVTHSEFKTVTVEPVKESSTPKQKKSKKTIKPEESDSTEEIKPTRKSTKKNDGIIVNPTICLNSSVCDNAISTDRRSVPDSVVTVTRIEMSTKTMHEPFTLYREFTTTKTVDRPIINYKVTTMTSVITKTETETETRFAPNRSRSTDSCENSSCLAPVSYINTCMMNFTMPRPSSDKTSFYCNHSTEHASSYREPERITVTVDRTMPSTVSISIIESIRTLTVTSPSPSISKESHSNDRNYLNMDQSQYKTVTTEKTVTASASELERTVTIERVVTVSATSEVYNTVTVDRSISSSPPIKSLGEFRTVTVEKYITRTETQEHPNMSMTHRPEASSSNEPTRTVYIERPQMFSSVSVPISTVISLVEYSSKPSSSVSAKAKSMSTGKSNLPRGCHLDNIKGVFRLVCKHMSVPKTVKKSKSNCAQSSSARIRRKRTVIRTVYKSQDEKSDQESDDE